MRKRVGVVGIEFAVHLISPADSVALVRRLPLEMQLRGRILWSRCGHFQTKSIINLIAMYDLRRTIENFAQQLRSKFRAEIELDAAQFKRRAVGLFPRNLPPQPGRPCAHPVTCAFRFRARKRPWPEVYRACLPASAGYESESICALPCG